MQATEITSFIFSQQKNRLDILLTCEAVTAGEFKFSAFVERGERLRQAVCVKANADALLACKKWVVAIHALCLLCVSLQF